jgi:predicted NUDIX family NTP pyrophosphohydrolase
MKISAGLLMYRWREENLEVLLAHPGGPFWRNKDEGAWSVCKGEAATGEDLLATAIREFAEETGVRPAGPFVELTPVRQKGGKIVHAWAVAGNCDPAQIRSNSFRLEYPPRSGLFHEFPEIDRAEFFSLDTARKKINPAQVVFLDELAAQLHGIQEPE